MAGVMNMTTTPMKMGNGGYQGQITELCKNINKCKEIKPGSKGKKNRPKA